MPLRFTFAEPEAPQLIGKCVEALMHTANSYGGIALVDEVLNAPKVDAADGARSLSA